MSRFLAIDWDQQEMHIASGMTGRGGVRIEQAFTWSMPEPLSIATDEALGRQLAEVLKKAGIPPAPVLACVGRERIILKELKLPPVADSDEAGLVRFQAVKELSEPAEEVFIDYTRIGGNGSPGMNSGDRQVLAVIVRREVVHMLRGFCRGLGRKLLGVAPRSTGVCGAFERTAGEGTATAKRDGDAPGRPHAVLSAGKQWADLSVLRGGNLQFTRSVVVGPSLTNEVKRTLAIYAAQFGTPVETLHIAGTDGAALTGPLVHALGLPVHELNPFAEQDGVRVAERQRGVFAGAIGLLHEWGLHGALPVNFVAPKEPKAPPSGPSRTVLYVAAIAAACLLLLIVGGYVVLSNKRAAIQQLAEDKKMLETEIKKLGQDRLDMDALRDWDQSTVPWLDEFYDLAARFPYQQDFRLKQLSAQPLKRSAAEKHVARMTLTIVGPADKEPLVTQFVEAINQDPHLRAHFERSTPKEFHVKIDILKQSAEKYTTKLTPPPRPKAAPPPVDPEAQPMPDDFDLEGALP